MSDKVLELIYSLDNIARRYEAYDYGLPIYDDEILEQMVQTVERWLEEVKDGHQQDS
jgi:hypothetical protein